MTQHRRDLAPVDPKSVRPWAIIAECAPGRVVVITQEGEVIERRTPLTIIETLASLHETHVLCVTTMRPLFAATGPRAWVIKRRAMGNVLSIRHDEGFRVVYLPQCIPYGMDGAMATGRYLNALAEYGVGLTHRATWTSLATYLHRATLDQCYPAPKGSLAREGFVGGRKQAQPCKLTRAVYYDLQSSYPRASASSPLPLVLQQRAPTNAPPTLPAEGDGIVGATVLVPNRFAKWAPLPLRVHPLANVLRWEWGQLSGWWPIGELREAMRYGVELLYVHELHVGSMYVDLFGNFARVTDKLRRDHGAVAKQHSNAVWSSFATRPSETLYHRVLSLYPLETRDERPPAIGGDFAARSAFVSSIISGRVRSRLWSEFLFPEGWERTDAVYVDTDGGIAGRRRRPVGDDWRAREMTRVQVHDVGLYEYECARCTIDHAPGHAISSGTASEAAARDRIRRGNQ